MTVLIVASERDQAALNIALWLVREYGFDRSSEYPNPRITRKNDVLLARVEEESVHLDTVDSIAETQSVIFASRHTSEKGQPCLTVHCTGNILDEAPYGGKPRSLAPVEPKRMRAALLSLSRSREELGLSYLVSLEATHHGPTELKVPSMFVEIGSSLKEWKDPTAGKAVARAIWAAATSPSEGTSAVGFGGGHYSWKHTEAVIEGEFALGHIFSKYFFESYEPAMIDLAFRKTIGDCAHGIIDKKGVPSLQRRLLIEHLERSNRKVVVI